MKAEAAATAYHEAAHLVVALLLGVAVRRASVTPGRCRVELADPDREVRRPGGLRRLALVAAAGPASDLRFDSRGWRGYVMTDSRNDLAKLAHLVAVAPLLQCEPLEVEDVLREADTLVWGYGVFVSEAASYLHCFQTLEGPLLRQLAPRFGAGLNLSPGGGRAVWRSTRAR